MCKDWCNTLHCGLYLYYMIVLNVFVAMFLFCSSWEGEVCGGFDLLVKD